jgi:hypothetical protein
LNYDHSTSLGGKLRVTKMQKEVLALQRDPLMYFTHVFMDNGDQVDYDELFCLIRTGMPVFNCVHKLCLAVSTDEYDVQDSVTPSILQMRR